VLLMRRGLFGFNTFGDWSRLLECAGEASRLAAATDDHVLRLRMAAGVANAQFQASEFSQALVCFDEALALAEARPDVAVPLATLETLYRFRGRTLCELGRLVESRADLDRADQLGREGDSTQIGNFQALLDVSLGNLRAALDLARTQALAAERFGSPFRRIQCRTTLGRALRVNGHAGEAVETLASALVLIEESNASRYIRAGILTELAEAQLSAGESEPALASAEESVAEASATGMLRFEVPARVALARALLAAQGARGAERAAQELERARVLVEQTGARLWWPEILLVRAELARVRGDDAARVRELREAQRALREMGATPRADAIARELSA
jgi:adenylate cyclase